MDKHHAVAGVGGTIHIRDRDYRLRPLTLGDLAEIKAHVVSRRMSPLEALGRELERVDPKHHAELMRAALREACAQRAATAAEIDAYLQSFDGTAHLFWLMARDDCPALDSLAAARACLADFATGRLLELQGRLDQATGFLSDTANLELLGPGSTDGDSDAQWARLYRRLSLAYHWTPAQINDLTVFQAALYLRPELSERGTLRMKLADAHALRKHQRQAP